MSIVVRGEQTDRQRVAATPSSVACLSAALLSLTIIVQHAVCQLPE